MVFYFSFKEKKSLYTFSVLSEQWLLELFPLEFCHGNHSFYNYSYCRIYSCIYYLYLLLCLKQMSQDHWIFSSGGISVSQNPHRSPIFWRKSSEFCSINPNQWYFWSKQVYKKAKCIRNWRVGEERWQQWNL